MRKKAYRNISIYAYPSFHSCFLPESIELTAKPTPFPTTHRTTPPTAHVKITKQRHGHTTTTTTSSILEDLDSFVVEALPPPKVVEAGKYSSSFTTHRPTTLNKPPRTSSPPLDSSPDFDESGSGEPSGDDEMVSGMEESGEEPLGNAFTIIFQS